MVVIKNKKRFIIYSFVFLGINLYGISCSSSNNTSKNQEESIESSKDFQTIKISSCFENNLDDVTFSDSTNGACGNTTKQFTECNYEKISSDTFNDSNILHNTAKIGVVSFLSKTVLNGATYSWTIKKSESSNAITTVTCNNPAFAYEFKNTGDYIVELEIKKENETYNSNGLITISNSKDISAAISDNHTLLNVFNSL